MTKREAKRMAYRTAAKWLDALLNVAEPHEDIDTIEDWWRFEDAMSELITSLSWRGTDD